MEEHSRQRKCQAQRPQAVAYVLFLSDIRRVWLEQREKLVARGLAESRREPDIQGLI